MLKVSSSHLVFSDTLYNTTSRATRYIFLPWPFACKAKPWPLGQVKNTYRPFFPSATLKLSAFGYVLAELIENFTVSYNPLMGVQGRAMDG